MNGLRLVGLFVAGSASLYAGTMGPISKHVNNISARAIYGKLSSGMEITMPYVDVSNANYSSNKTMLPSVNNNWGFQIASEFMLNADTPRNLRLSYLYLNNGSNAAESGRNIYNRVSVTGAQNAYSPGSVGMQTYYQYQTLNLDFTPAHLTSTAINVDHGLFYGIRGTYIKSGFNSQFAGDAYGDTPNAFNNAYFSNEFYGIGPEIGDVFNWAATSFFDLGGSLNIGLVFGNSRARYNETWNPVNLTGNNNGGGNYSQVHGTTSWGALVLGGEIKAGFHYETKNNDEWRVEGGIGGDQYLASHTNSYFSYAGGKTALGRAPSENNPNTITLSNQFLFRNVFIGLSYRG